MMNIQLPDIPAPVAALVARAEADCRPAFVRVEEIEEPLMREIRYLDKLIDELAKGKQMDKILRKERSGDQR